MVLFHCAPAGLDARNVLNWATWSTTDLNSSINHEGWGESITYSTVGRNGVTRAESIVAPPDAKLKTYQNRFVTAGAFLIQPFTFVPATL